MTAEDAKDWAVAHDCDAELSDGINRSHPSYYITKKHSNAYFYLSGPFHVLLPLWLVKQMCEALYIPKPTCVAEKETGS